METPVFRLGLVGFNEREEQLLRAGAAAYRQVDWRCGRAEGADAWMIKGARIARIQENRLRVVASEGTNTGAAFLLDAGSRPVAIATPAPQQVAQIAPLFFDPAQEAALAGALAALDAQLDRLRRQYWAASLLVEHTPTVGKALYELRTFDQVLAVADMKGAVHIAPKATSDQFDHAVWRHRARKSVEVLPDFERHPLAELLWAYATRAGGSGGRRAPAHRARARRRPGLDGQPGREDRRGRQDAGPFHGRPVPGRLRHHQPGARLVLVGTGRAVVHPQRRLQRRTRAGHRGDALDGAAAVACYSRCRRNQSGIGTDFCAGKSTQTVVAPPDA